MITGYSLLDSGFKTNAGTFFVTFKDFEERYASIDDREDARTRARSWSDFFREGAERSRAPIVIPIAPPAIPGIGTTGGFEFWIQDTGAGDPAQLDAVMQDFLKKARARPELTGLATTFRANTQQLRADVDRDKAHAARRSDPGRLQRDPGAVRLADGEPVQPVQPTSGG